MRNIDITKSPVAVWTKTTQRNCSCLKWEVNSTTKVSRPVCTHPDNRSRRCIFNKCPKLL
nr:MAG TPA: hypothetical protein [Caudoviricetes sp.]